MLKRMNKVSKNKTEGNNHTNGKMQKIWYRIHSDKWSRGNKTALR